MQGAARVPGLVVFVLVCAQTAIASQKSTCSAGTNATCDARRSGAARGIALVQVSRGHVSAGLVNRASSASGKQQAFQAEVAAHLRKGFASPDTMAMALSSGLTAVRKVLVLFSAEPPQIDEGLDLLGSGMLDAILTLTPAETQLSEEFQKFKTMWEGITQTLSSALDVSSSIAAYKEDGNVAAVIDVLERALQELGGLVSQFLPQEVSVEVTRYLAAVEDSLDGLGDALEEFVEGDTIAAVQSLYTGIRLASEELLPPNVLNNEVFQEIAGALDSVFEDLSATVLKFRQQLLESNVCWKTFARRDRVRPDRCPEKHYFDGEQWCIFNPHASMLQDKQPALLETSVEKKSRKPHESALPSTCDRHGEYPTKKGAWCYKDCPYGTEPAGNRCKSVCMGNYPVNSPLMCGNSPGTVSAAIMQMTAQGVRTVVTAAGAFGKDAEAGGLKRTVDGLVDLGVTFTHPTCPSLG